MPATIQWTEILSSHPSYGYITKKIGNSILSPQQDCIFYDRKYTPLLGHVLMWISTLVLLGLYINYSFQSLWVLTLFPLLALPVFVFLITKKHTSLGDERHDFILTHRIKTDLVTREIYQDESVTQYVIKDPEVLNGILKKDLRIEQHPCLFSLIGEYGKKCYQRKIVAAHGGQFNQLEELSQDIQATRNMILERIDSLV